MLFFQKKKRNISLLLCNLKIKKLKLVCHGKNSHRVTQYFFKLKILKLQDLYKLVDLDTLVFRFLEPISLLYFTAHFLQIRIFFS